MSAFASLAGGEDVPPVKLDIRGDVADVSDAAGGALFRIAQEAVTKYVFRPSEKLTIPIE